MIRAQCRQLNIWKKKAFKKTANAENDALKPYASFDNQDGWRQKCVVDGEAPPLLRGYAHFGFRHASQSAEHRGEAKSDANEMAHPGNVRVLLGWVDTY